jgi:hypothetical protein
LPDETTRSVGVLIYSAGVAAASPGVFIGEQKSFCHHCFASAADVIPFLIQSEIRREAADSATARQAEARTYRIELEME